MLQQGLAYLVELLWGEGVEVAASTIRRKPGVLYESWFTNTRPKKLLYICCSITQYISMLSHVQTLPLELEKVVEVMHRDWTVKPAASKHPRLANMAEEREEGREKYICRPSHVQPPHTGMELATQALLAMLHLRAKIAISN